MQVRRFPLLAPLIACLVSSAAAQQRVIITGGVDQSGQNYEWTVRNENDSPLVWISFPHYRADTFITPEGWTQNATHLDRANVKDAGRPGVCEATAPAGGLRRGASEKFGMRISVSGADPRPGRVTVRFADGTEAIVSEVQLPTPKSLLDRYATPVALGALFVAFLLYKSRRKPPAEPDAPVSA